MCTLCASDAYQGCWSLCPCKCSGDRLYPVLCQGFLAHNGARGQHEGTAVLGVSRAETCGGVMVRGPASGNGERSGVYYPVSADLAPPRPQARALYDDQAHYDDRDEYGETALYGQAASYDRVPYGGTLDGGMDPFLADVRADGTLAASQGFGRGGRGAGGRWLLWPLRIVLWAALLVVVFRGLTAIIVNHTAAPAGGAGSPNAASGQFPVAMAEAYATEFGRVYFAFSPQNVVRSEE